MLEHDGGELFLDVIGQTLDVSESALIREAWFHIGERMTGCATFGTSS